MRDKVIWILKQQDDVVNERNGNYSSKIETHSDKLSHQVRLLT